MYEIIEDLVGRERNLEGMDQVKWEEREEDEREDKRLNTHIYIGIVQSNIEQNKIISF